MSNEKLKIKNFIAHCSFLIADTFELPADFDFPSRCGGGKFGAFAGEDSVDFVIDFYAESREYVKSCIWADNQTFTDFEDEDKTRISLDGRAGKSYLMFLAF